MSENIHYLSPQHYAQLVLNLSREISGRVKTMDWEAAQSLEQQRYVAMQELFNHPEINEALPSMASLLHEVMNLDAEVIIKGETELQSMSSTLSNMGKGKRAINAYLNT